jgi:hypothetical protein
MVTLSASWEFPEARFFWDCVVEAEGLPCLRALPPIGRPEPKYK